RAAVVIVPSVVDERTGETEAQNVTILEALASGRPVVASRVGGVPDAVNETNGRLVEPGDPHAIAVAVRELLEHPEEAAALGASGRRLVEERYSWPAIAERFAAIYERVAP